MSDKLEIVSNFFFWRCKGDAWVLEIYVGSLFIHLLMDFPEFNHPQPCGIDRDLVHAIFFE